MNAAIRWLRTESSRAWTIQRLALAAVILPFGAQSGISVDAPMPVLIVAATCALLLAAGFLSRLAAAGASAIFLAALLAGDALALPLLGLAVSIALVARGGGAISLDYAIVEHFTTLPLEQEITTDGLIVGRRVGEYDT